MKESTVDKADATVRNRSSESKEENIHSPREGSEAELSLLEDLARDKDHDSRRQPNESTAIDLSDIPLGGRISAMLALQHTYGNRYVQAVVDKTKSKDKSQASSSKHHRLPSQFNLLSMPSENTQRYTAGLNIGAPERVVPGSRLANKSIGSTPVAIHRKETNAEAGPSPESQPNEGPSDTQPSSQQPSQEVLASIALAQTILGSVKPLPPEQKGNISQAIASSSIYAMIEERDANFDNLKNIKRDVEEKAPGGVQPEAQQKIEALASRIQDLDARIKAEMAALGITDENVIADQVAGFVEIWINQANQIVFTMLDKSSITIEEESLKYRTSPEDIRGLKSADKDLAEFVAPIQTELDTLKQLEAETGKTEGLEGSSAGEYYKSKKDLQCKSEELKAKISNYSGKYPVLLHPQYSPGAFQNMAEEQISEATSGWLEKSSEKIKNIYGQIGNEIKAWDLPGVTTATFQILNVDQNSLLGKAVQDRISTERSEAELLESAKNSLMLGTAVLSMPLLSVGVFVGMLAGGVMLGTSLSILIDDINKYSLQSDLQNPTLDPEINKILSQGEPDLISIVMDLIFIAVDLTIIGNAARNLRGPVSELKANRKTAEKFINDAKKSIPEDKATILARKYSILPKQAGDIASSSASPMLDLSMIANRIEQNVQGAIPRLALKLLKKGVKSLDWDTLKLYYKSRAELDLLLKDNVLNWRGYYEPRFDLIFINPLYSIDAVTSTMIHETVHRLQKMAGRLVLDETNRFVIEFQAYSAQQQYLRIAREAGAKLPDFENRLADMTSQELMEYAMETGPYGGRMPHGFDPEKALEEIFHMMGYISIY